MIRYLPRKITAGFTTISSHDRGFTLIELIVALTILTILAVTVFAALNPAQRLKDSKDARRTADASEILTAIHQSVVDNKGTFQTNFPAAGTEKQLGSPAGGCAATTVGICTLTAGCADLMADVAQDLLPYLASMPIDPAGSAGGATAAATGYSVKRDTNGIVTVKACYTDGTTPITVSR